MSSIIPILFITPNVHSRFLLSTLHLVTLNETTRKPLYEIAQLWHALSMDHTALPATHTFIYE